MEAIVLKALQKDREYRFQSMRELMAAIDAVGTGAAAVSVVAEDVVVLGEDRTGAQVSLQERMRPLLAVFVLTMEALALASLVASEIEQRKENSSESVTARTSSSIDRPVAGAAG